MVIKPSKISGTSVSNKRSKNTGEVRDTIIEGVPFFISTLETTALTVSPFLKKSDGICSVFGNNSSFPSSSISIISFFQT